MGPENNIAVVGASAEDKKKLLARIAEETKEFDNGKGSKKWEDLSPETQAAIEKSKKDDRKKRKMVATGGRKNEPKNVVGAGDIEQEDVKDTYAERVINSPDSVISHEDEDELAERMAGAKEKDLAITGQEEEVENIEELKQKLGMAELSLEEAEAAYREKVAENEKAAKSFLVKLWLRKIDDQAQTKDEEKLLRQIMEERKKTVEDLKQKIQDLEPKQEKEKPNTIFDGFKELGIKKEELEKMDGFENLSEGQKLLVLENLKQLTLGRIQEEAAESVDKDIAKSNILGKIWKNIGKKFYIAKKEKMTAKELMGGGMGVHGEMLGQLIAGAKDGPGVEVKDGKLEIQYVSGLDNLTPEQEGQVAEFNTIATEFSKIPYEWSLDTAGGKEKKRYQEVRARYQESVRNIFDIKNERDGGDMCKTAVYISNLEKNVQLNQFLSSNPEVEEQLASIKDDALWTKALANIVTEKGVYSGIGFLARTGTVSLIGLAGAPLVAASMGGVMAWRRAKESLKDKDRKARKGGPEDKSEEAKEFMDVKYLQEPIGDLISVIESLSGAVAIEGKDSTQYLLLSKEQIKERREEALRSLKFNLSEAQRNLEAGTVNFGEKKDRVFNQYELIKNISRGSVLLEANKFNIDNKKYDGNPEAKANINIEEKIKESILNARKEYDNGHIPVFDPKAIERDWRNRVALEGKGDLQAIMEIVEQKNTEISEARRRYLLEKTLNGVVMGATFASIGAAARHFGEAWFGWKGSENVAGGGADKSTEPAKYDLTVPAPADNLQPGNVPAAVAGNMAKPVAASAAGVGGSHETVTRTGASDGDRFHAGNADTHTSPQYQEGIPKGSSIEREIIKKFEEAGLDKKDAGKYAHRMVQRFIDDNNGKTSLEALNKVKPGELLKFDIDPKNPDSSSIQEFRGMFGHHADATSLHNDTGAMSGEATGDSRMDAITRQMEDEAKERGFNNHIIGEQVKEMNSVSPGNLESIESNLADGAKGAGNSVAGPENIESKTANLDRYAGLRNVEISKALENIKELSEKFGGNVFNEAAISSQLELLRGMDGNSPGFMEVYGRICGKIASGIFKGQGVNSLETLKFMNAQDYIENSNNPQILKVIKFAKHVKGFDVTAKKNETLWSWTIMVTDQMMMSCGVEFKPRQVF